MPHAAVHVYFEGKLSPFSWTVFVDKSSTSYNCSNMLATIAITTKICQQVRKFIFLPHGRDCQEAADQSLILCNRGPYSLPDPRLSP